MHAKNGIPVHIIRAGTKNALKLDIVFKAGTRISSPLIPKATADLMVEATKNYSSELLSNTIDSNGGYLYSDIDRDRASISMVVIEKFFNNLITPFQETITKPKFEQIDFDRYKVTRKQQHIHSLENTSMIASRAFAGQLFGKEHPYGRMAIAEDYDNLDLDVLRSFHKKQYVNEGTYAILTGQFSETTFKKVIDVIESIPEGNNSVDIDFTTNLTDQKTNYIPKTDAQQATVKMGYFWINRTHPDYPKLRIANTILGGYFGSRLMQVIREQKGYTYGIGSSLVSLEHGAYWSVSGDVLIDKAEEVLSDINTEIELLKTELISDDELQMIRNYLTGDILQNFDGPFAIADTYRTLSDYGLNFAYFKSLEEAILSINKKELRDIMQKYFDYDKAVKTIVSCK